MRRGSRRKSGATTAAAAAAAGNGTLRFRNVGGLATARSSLLGGFGSAGIGAAAAATRQGYSALGESEGIMSGGRGASGASAEGWGGEWNPV